MWTFFFPIFLPLLYLKLMCCEEVSRPSSCQDIQTLDVIEIGYYVAYDNISQPFILYCGEEDGMTSARDKLTFTARNCKELQEQGMDADGTSIIYPFASQPETPVLVYCDQTTDQGGWTVIQRRFDGRERFFRSYEAYENGFGVVDTEFWLGNMVIHELTEQTVNEIRIDLEDFYGEQKYANYKMFHIAGNDGKDRDHHYQLDVALYSGTAGDSFSYHDGGEFSTFDADHDITDEGNCAIYNHGAWWYIACCRCSLNGRYYDYAETEAGGIYWDSFHPNQLSSSLQKTSMKIRPFQGL